jgi:hypothetical protein
MVNGWQAIVGQGVLNPNNPLAKNPFALSLSKGRTWFDRLTPEGCENLCKATSGLSCLISANGLSGLNRCAGFMQKTLSFGERVPKAGEGER